MAKNASGAAFLNSKKRAEEMLLAQESGLDCNDAFSDQDIFNMQHHHLLNCLEKTTVSLFSHKTHKNRKKPHKNS